MAKSVTQNSNRYIDLGKVSPKAYVIKAEGERNSKLWSFISPILTSFKTWNLFYFKIEYWITYPVLVS